MYFTMLSVLFHFLQLGCSNAISLQLNCDNHYLIHQCFLKKGAASAHCSLAIRLIMGERAREDFILRIIRYLLCMGWSTHVGRIYGWEASFISSVRSSSGYHGLLHIYKPSFSNFSNSSDSKVKVKVKVKGPNMCYIFEKHGIQVYRI